MFFKSTSKLSSFSQSPKLLSFDEHDHSTETSGVKSSMFLQTTFEFSPTLSEKKYRSEEHPKQSPQLESCLHDPPTSEFWSHGKNRDPFQKGPEKRGFNWMAGGTFIDTDNPHQQNLVDDFILTISEDSETSEHTLVDPDQLALVLENYMSTNNNISSKILESGLTASSEQRNTSLKQQTNLNCTVQAEKIKCELSPQQPDLHSRTQPEKSIMTINKMEEESKNPLKRIAKNQLDNVQTKSPVNTEAIRTHEIQGSTLKLVIIDCRYHYEYQGSHIRSAINISSPKVLNYLFTRLRRFLFKASFLSRLLALEGREIEIKDLDEIAFETEVLSQIHKSDAESDLCCRDGLTQVNTEVSASANSKDVVPVFVLHCEFSSKRGPKFYSKIRNLDRSHNENQYPKLSFPQLFVLKGGFEGFFGASPHLCRGEDTYRPMALHAYKDQFHMNEKRVTAEWQELKMAKNTRVPLF